jgi:hypothetical protein
MQHYLLREEPAGSCQFTLTGEVLDLPAQDASAACTARQAAEGIRYALLPYSALRQPAAAVPVPADDEAEQEA